VNRSSILSACFFLGLAISPAFSLGEKMLNSNLEVTQPTQGTWGVTFCVTNNNLGNGYWVDPVSNNLSSYSEAGLGGKYYINNRMRIGATIDFFINSWNYANKDTESLHGGALRCDFDYIFFASGPIDLYAGPMAEAALAWGSYDSDSSSITTTFSGQTYSFGCEIGAEFFLHSQFSIGASCPIMYRIVTTKTDNSSALVGPTESSFFALGSICLDLTYYF